MVATEVLIVGLAASSSQCQKEQGAKQSWWSGAERMFWERCTAIEQFQSPPAARVGHVALAVDASASWGEEFLLIHGGLSEKKVPLSDLVVLQVSSQSATGHAAPIPASLSRIKHRQASIAPDVCCVYWLQQSQRTFQGQRNEYLQSHKESSSSHLYHHYEHTSLLAQK